MMMLLRLRRSDVVSDEAQDVVATFELATAVAAHREVLDDLDDSRLKQARPGLGQTTLGGAADQPLKLVAERVAEMLCNGRTHGVTLRGCDESTPNSSISF